MPFRLYYHKLYLERMLIMAENCTHNCSTCSSNCAKKSKADLLEAPHQLSSVKKIIGVVSGKGGVGKSLVTSLMAVLAARRGLKAGILDGDITGPSIPKVFGLDGARAEGDENGIYPVRTKTGIEVMSLNLLIDEPTEPVIWRGPMIAGAVKQFWTDVIWHELDVLFIDMPPGTGDVPLTVFQSVPVDGIVVVTSPQELVSMIVEKAVKMADKMDIQVLGAVENYSYVVCPDCGKKISVFGDSHIDKYEREFEFISRLPIDMNLAKLCDEGRIEDFSGDWLDDAADKIFGGIQ